MGFAESLDYEKKSHPSKELEPLTNGDNPNQYRRMTDEKKCKDFDDILQIVGSEGKFQKILLYIVLCPIVTISPFLVLNNIFILDIPDHWCRVPGRPNGTDLLTWKNLTIPFESGLDGIEKLSSCKMFALNSTEDDIHNGTFGGGGSSKREEIGCKYGWEFDKTDYESTIPSEFSWVCDRNHFATDVFTWTNVGSAVGTVIFGIAADKFGRKPVFYASCFVNIFFKTASLFLPQHVYPFLALQFLGGTAFPAMFSMPALIAAEVCSPAYRSWTYAVTWMIWVIGNSLLPLVAWACRGWFLLGVVSVIPGALLFFYWPILNESPRWLITAGRGKEAVEIILKMAKTNGNLVDPEEIKGMVDSLIVKQVEENKNRRIGFWTLFQKPRLARNTILLCIAWGMNMMLYYGITLKTTSMAGNRFLNYFLLSLIELPSGYLAGVLVEKTGRRWTQAGFFLLCVLSCFTCAVAVLQPDFSVLVIVGALGIKFGVTITSLVVYLQGAEIFPTQLRSTGSGLASTISSCLGVTGPYIVFTGTIHAALPYTILGIFATVGLLASACLPETFRQRLPETVEDANKFGKGVKFWSFLPEDNRMKDNNSNEKKDCK